MNRRFLLAVVGVCCAAAWLSATVWADPPGVVPDEVVFPTGEFPTDVENVQDAVDQGGTVLLKATNRDGEPTAFNFGPPDAFVFGSVDLETDVWVLGETAGSRMTTIEGGVFPLFGRDGHVRIEGIHFDGPLLSAIIVVRSTGAEVIGNRITRVVPLPPEFGFTEARAIKFLANAFPITGTVVVADNVIEDSLLADYSDDIVDFSDGIVFDEVEADVYIEGNMIVDVQDNGILMFNSRGPVHIRDNLIVPGPGVHPSTLGNGIALSNAAGIDNTHTSYEITGNDVICENPSADGMYLFGIGVTIDAPVVSRNHVTMHGSFFGAITFYGSVSRARVSNNRIDGEGDFGFLIARVGAGTAESNTFVGNNISGFDASLVDVFLGAHTHDTVFVGPSGTVFDLGTDNQITGLSKIGHGEPIGPQISKAQSLRPGRDLSGTR